MTKALISCMLCALSTGMPAFGQTNVGDQPPEDNVRKNVLYQLDIYAQTTDYISNLFQKFSDGYIEADPALTKVLVMEHEYKKRVEPVPKEAEKLYGLMNDLFSSIEEYFVYYKNVNKENPEIDIKMAKLRYELHKQVVKLQYEYM